MPRRAEAPLGAPCWIDLFSSDTAKSIAFYGGLFGWSATEPSAEHGGYINFLKDGDPIAGMMANDGSTGQPDTWSVHLAVADAAKTVEASAANGASVIVPAMQVAELGTMSLIADPGGAAIGGWQPGAHKGFLEVGEPNTPGWFELQTREYDRSVTFYREVFGWDAHTMSDTADFRYTTLGEGETASAGIQDASASLPDGAPAEWSVYFSCADTDAALARVVELGGTILAPAEDTPYGRLAAFADVTGARAKLIAN
jgi:predicted enzyme related to lactoylglutathione lyase